MVVVHDCHICTQVAIQLSPSTVKDESLFISQNILYEQLEVKKEKIEALERHLRELEDIRIKALHGLQDLDGKRVKLQNEISQVRLVVGPYIFAS